MDNPYATPSQGNFTSKNSGGFLLILIAFPIVVIAANYATATSLRIDLPDIFGHVVFLVAPVSFLIHLPNLSEKSNETWRSKTRWLFLAVLLIPASFLLSFSTLFSSNKYYIFRSANQFFGSDSWMIYTWLIVLGILPFLELIPAIQRSRLTMMLLSLLSIGFHIHNAYWIWVMCHLSGTRE